MWSGFQGVGAEWVVEVGVRDYQGWGGWHGRKRWVRGRTDELQAGHREARKRRQLRLWRPSIHCSWLPPGGDLEEGRAMVTTSREPNTDRQTRTEQCWDPLFPAVSLSSEALGDPQTCCQCSLGDPQCVSPAAGPQRERRVPLTQPHQSSPRPGLPPAFLSILQWTPCAHHPSPYESTVHVETPQPSEPQDVGSSPGGPPPPDTASWSHLGPACS